jgi:hypothetical protein
MSVNVMWRPINPGKSISVGHRSDFMSLLGKAFGASPIKLSIKDAEKLEGMMLSWTESKPFAEILKAINDYGEIEVYGEWS